jgi:tetratricopeptide (TPR) repeat protein
MVRSAHHEARGYLEQALSALLHLPETRATREQAIDLRLALRTALNPLGELGRILAYLREAEALAAALDDPRRLGQVSGLLASYFYNVGAYDQAIAASQRALALATTSGDVGLHALANYFLGGNYLNQGNYRQAIDSLRQTVETLVGARRHERFGNVALPAVQSRALLAWCHAELGRFAEGRALAEEGRQIAETVAHPASLMWAYYGIGLPSLRQGDLPRALSQLERALGSCQEIERPAHFPAVAAALGAAYTLCGRVADAVLLLTQVLEQTTAGETVAYRARCNLSLGEAQLLAGRLEEAYALAERALALARAYQERGHRAYALRLLGDIAARHEPPESESAEAYYRQALALAGELGMRPLVAHCHLGLGRLYGQTGRGAQARAALTTAIDLYHAMDMTFWLPQAEAALAQWRESKGL